MKADIEHAKSLLAAAKRDHDYTQSLTPTENGAATIIRNTWEAFRMLGQALLKAHGIPSADHQTPLRELLRLDVKTRRPPEAIDHVRRLRNNVNYDGYNPTKEEARDVQDLADACFTPLAKAVEERLDEMHP